MFLPCIIFAALCNTFVLVDNTYGYTLPFAHFLGSQDVETKFLKSIMHKRGFAWGRKCRGETIRYVVSVFASNVLCGLYLPSYQCVIRGLISSRSLPGNEN